MLGKGMSVGPLRNERGMSSLGSDDRGVEVCRGDGIEEESILEGENAVIIVGTSIVIWVTGKGISMVGCPGLMEEADIVVAKGENIAGEMAVDFLRTTIVLKVFVVGEDIDNKFGT